MAETDKHEQEIRFAVVLYGGVSLAIYINGVVQELLRLVRSTSGKALPDVVPAVAGCCRFRARRRGGPVCNHDRHEGVPVPIQLFDNTVYERRHRNVFRFRYRKGWRNDFQADNNPFLAFAARCTSSFPFAFEAMQLCNIDEFLKTGAVYPAKYDYCKSESNRWQKFFTNYLEGVLPTSTKFPQRSFGDGGYLNNAPFSYAVDTLLARQADVPVDRKLIYVEPSPAHPEEEASETGKPNAIQNSIDALVTIPGYQTIRGDLTRVLDRNRLSGRINKALAQAEVRIQQSPGLCPAPQDVPGEIGFLTDPCFHGYYQLRATDVTDYLALSVARIMSIDEGSAHFVALRSLVRAWREAEYGVDPRTRSAQAQARFRARPAALPHRFRSSLSCTPPAIRVAQIGCALWIPLG
jgi:patatin-related protein